MSGDVQDGLSAADQSSPLLLDADQQLAQASQEVLTAGQGFLSAADAGDLSTFSGQLEAGLPLSEAAAALYGGVLDVEFTDLIAQFDPSILAAF